MSELNELLAGADDLGAWQQAIDRERCIRITMAETGESREIVTQTMDAERSMDQEAFLDLTEGQPTTLKAALARWLELVQAEAMAGDPEAHLNDLAALLDYPYPAEETVTHEDQPMRQRVAADAYRDGAGGYDR